MLELKIVLETLESMTSFSGPSVELTETLEVRLEVRLIASVLMVDVAPPVGNSVTELLEFLTSVKPSSLGSTLASLTVELSEACNL